MFLPYIKNYGFSGQIFMKVPDTKFQGNPSGGNRAGTWWVKERHDEDNS